MSEGWFNRNQTLVYFLIAQIVLQLIVLQTLDGRSVYVNPAHIVSVSETNEDRDPSERLLTAKVHCVINLTNGTKVSVAEDCDSVRQRLQGIAHE